MKVGEVIAKMVKKDGLSLKRDEMWYILYDIAKRVIEKPIRTEFDAKFHPRFTQHYKDSEYDKLRVDFIRTCLIEFESISELMQEMGE